MNNNPFKGHRIEFHILQSFPVTCLNRDDVGAPKTALVGGSTRARVSSQCWKRQVRLTMHEIGIPQGCRTKLIAPLIAEACRAQGADKEQALACGEKFEQIFIKKKNDKKHKKGREDDEAETIDSVDLEPDKTDTLLFLSPGETTIIAKAFAEKGFVPDAVITQKDQKKQAKEIADLLSPYFDKTDAYDIAIFGRMVAQASDLNIEAAASFSHAISTHKVSNEVEFFTALDDRAEEPGSAHMGSLEFNSATYYRYISLDLGQLWVNLGKQDITDAVGAFTKALFLAVPSARQATQSGASPWEYAKIYIRQGQRLQVPFETAVKAQNGGFLKPSITELNEYLDKKAKLFGSLFGQLNQYTFGVNEEFTIDNLVDKFQNFIRTKA